MRRLVATLTGAALLAAAMPVWAASPALTDLNGHWARTQVEAGIAAGYVAGYPDGTFRPNAQITRAEFTKLLSAALRLKAPAGATGFAEDWQSPPHWAFGQGYVGAAVNAGLVNPADYAFAFSPDVPISRREMVVQAVRTLGQESLTLTYKGALKAPDAAAYPGWLRAYAGLALDDGIITGYEDGSLSLSRTATRAEALVIVQRILGKVSVDAARAEAPAGVRHPGEGEPTWAWSGGNGAELTVTNGTPSQTYALSADTADFHLLPAPGKAAWVAYSQGGTGHVGRLAQGKLTELDTEEGKVPRLLAVDEDGRLWFNYGAE
ncbi:MAG TPA: S-layer homology domain-containing protein, partial [Symbiobacteriaceae bacterium]|nr:S-layer homology domain-containing protein [Symbiobacteriaceae bacterium]